MNTTTTLKTALLCLLLIGVAGTNPARGADPSTAPADAGADGPWPAPVPSFVAPRPGEHPRLFFRKGDLPQLRKRAATPEGQALLKRLRVLLNGSDGESLPSVYNASGKAYAGNKAGGAGDANSKDGGASAKKSGRNGQLPVGAYTIGHAAGFGLLYQLTGDRKYADLGRKCFEMALDGVRDRDDRYSFRRPGGALRCGPSIGAYAIGYDLCYDGWDEDFRRKAAEAFMKYDEGPNMSLESCALGKRQHPGSNHWGAEIGGPAMVLLALKGDVGADDTKIDELLDGNARCFVRELTEGFGDHGYFPEGDGPGAIASDTSFVPALQAWKVAGGKDFITPRPNAPWLTLKWVMGTIPEPVAVGGKPQFPTRGGYPHDVWARLGMSGSGTFAQGFGAVPEDDKPALLWLYDHTFKQGDEKAGAPCDTVGPYPHRAVLALVNWPWGAAEKNPATVLPKAVRDKKYAYFTFRNRWRDKDDIVVTALLKPSKGNGSVPAGDIMVLGLGRQALFPVKVTGDPTYFRDTATGGVLATAAGSFGVDFSGASGADALLVLAGPVRGSPPSGSPRRGGKGGGGAKNAPGINVQVVQAGANTFTLMTLGEGPALEAKADGDRLAVGGQGVSMEQGHLVFAK